MTTIFLIFSFLLSGADLTAKGYKKDKSDKYKGLGV
jgi:hypothetical protein